MEIFLNTKDLANEENLKVNSGVTEIDTAQITRDASGLIKRVG